MSSQINDTTIEKSITYDRTSRDYTVVVIIGGEAHDLGSAKSYSAGEALADNYVLDLIQDGMIGAADLHMDAEQVADVAAALEIALALVPSAPAAPVATDAPVTVGHLPDNTPVMSGYDRDGSPLPVQVETGRGTLFASAGGVAGEWDGVEIDLTVQQIAAVRALLAGGALDTLLALARWWEAGDLPPAPPAALVLVACRAA